MIPSPIQKVLSTMAARQVRALLMGGQACVFYGAAEFSRDTDLLILAEAENLGRLVLFSLATSAAWDIGRAITTVLLVGLTGSAVLAVLRRASRRAAFGAAPVFGT